MKLFRALTLMLVCLTTVPITVVGLILIESTVDLIKTMTWELQQERATNAARAVSGVFDKITDDVDLLVSNLNVASLNVRERQELLSFLLQKRPEVNIVAFYDAEGRPLPNLLAFDSNRILPSELAAHQKLVDTLDGQDAAHSVTFSEPYAIDRPARPELAIPVRREQVVAELIRLTAGDAAYLGMELSLQPAQNMINRMRLSRRGSLMLVAPAVRVVASSSDARWTVEQTSELERQLQPSLRILVAGGQSGVRLSGARPLQLPDGTDMLMAYSPLTVPGWWMVSVEPLDDAYRASRRMTWQVVWVVLVSLTVAVAIGVLFAFGLTRPIAGMVNGALAIARGRFGTEMQVRSRNEIGELAHTFNYMSRQLLYYDQQNKDLVASLERGYLETIRALANSIDAKDPYTRGHSGRVTRVALEVGRRLGMNADQLRMLRYGGILHDIGKIGITEAILGKKDQLDDAERESMRQHPVLGEKIIEPVEFLQPVRPLVRHHHEWFDGSGYPDGLRGEAIPLGARILSAADTYDAVTSERPYQKAVDNRAAIEIIHKLEGRQIDPGVSRALVELIEDEIAAGRLRPDEQTGLLSETHV